VHQSTRRTHLHCSKRSGSALTGLHKALHGGGRCIPVHDRSHPIPRKRRGMAVPSGLSLSYVKSRGAWVRHPRSRVTGGHAWPQTMEAFVPVIPFPNDSGHGPCKSTVLPAAPENQSTCSTISGRPSRVQFQAGTQAWQIE
jgi:hypothetical protein